MTWTSSPSRAVRRRLRADPDRSRLAGDAARQLDGTMLFYKSVFGFEAEPVHELVDPYGLIQSRVLESRDRTVRLPLNASASPRTATAQFLATYGGAGVHHIAIATDDIFATMEQMRARKVALLDIPDTYLRRPRDDARPSGRNDRPDARMSILYDRSATGEFFHAYTHAFDGRFFFEIVQRATMTGSARSMPRCGSPRRR
jgi:4-hydroxyphenylpyruvate dioxygenase